MATKTKQQRDAERRAREWAAQQEQRRLLFLEADVLVLDEYGDGFVDGYLRAHEDGDEYACSVRQARVAYLEYLRAGGRSLSRSDVEGW